MADFGVVLDLLRPASDVELGRILVQLKRPFRGPPKPVQGFPQLLNRFRNDTDEQLQQLLDELTEQYVSDNPDPDKDPSTRQERGISSIAKHLSDEKAAGRPRPNRKALEAHIRNAERISDRELQADLINSYDRASEFGLVVPRA